MVVGKYYRAKADVRKFIETSMYVEKKVTDDLKNVLLEKTKITEVNSNQLQMANEFVENYERGIVPAVLVYLILL